MCRVARVFLCLNLPTAGPRAALGWALTVGNTVAALFLLRGDVLVAGGLFLP